MHIAQERLEFNKWNGHVVRDAAGDYLLHVPTTAVFGVDALGLAVIEACRRPGGTSIDEIVSEFAGQYAPDRLRAFASELGKLEILQVSGSLKPINPAFQPMEFTAAEEGALQVEAELVEVLGGASSP